MRWAVVMLLVFCWTGAMGQAATDTTEAAPSMPEWRTPLYDQAEKIFNGLYLTPFENPALAGFDRQLVATYGGGVKNINVGGQVLDESPTPAFWNQRAMIDFAFVGKRKNIGVAIMYQGGREYRSHYNMFGIAHSYRFHIRKHRLTLGLGWLLTSQLVKDPGPFRDSFDLLYGFIYASPEMIYAKVEPLQTTGIHTGLFYDWKRLFFSYSFRFGARMPATQYSGVLPIAYWHTLSMGYHFRLPADLTLSPMLSAEHVSYRWHWTPTITVTWKDRVTLGISAPYLSHIRIDAGIQFWDRFRVAAGIGFYHQEFMQELNGMAYAGGSLRYMLPLWGK